MATAPPAGGGGGGSHILREYLVALGFRIDENRVRRFDGVMSGLDKRATRLGIALVGIGSAAAAMSLAFARSMERLYYNARYADVTVTKLKEMEFAGRSIGLAGGEMTAGLKTFAGALRANPGLQAMLTGKFGIKKGTNDEMFKDFIKATMKMPTYVANQFADMFGISPEMLFNLQKGMEEMEAHQARRAEWAKKMGIDTEQTAKDMKEVSQLWRDVTEQAGLFGEALISDIMPEIRDMAAYSSHILMRWRDISKEITRDGWKDFGKRILEGITGTAAGERVTLTRDARLRSGGTATPAEQKMQAQGKLPKADERVVDSVTDLEDFRRKRRDAQTPADSGGTDQPSSTFDPQQYLRDLERQYGLPPGLLDRVWSAESARGKKMFSPAGAQGHFQFMPKTAKAYGLKDPHDFKESGAAAARMWSDLMKWSGGDVRKAAAGYNWGMGNVNKYGLGRAPAETRGYMDKTAGKEGVAMVNTEVHVHGVSDPQRAAESVVRVQKQVAHDWTRNLSTKVR